MDHQNRREFPNIKFFGDLHRVIAVGTAAILCIKVFSKLAQAVVECDVCMARVLSYSLLETCVHRFYHQTIKSLRH